MRSKSVCSIGLTVTALLTVCTGCRSMGKMNLLGSKEIPVLTREEGLEYPAPSAAATPTELSAARDTPAAAESAFAASVVNSGDQTTSGIQFPAATTPSAPTGYPTTNYDSFPQQPESLAANNTHTPAPATSNPASFNRPVAQNTAPGAVLVDVQQGLYTARQSEQQSSSSNSRAVASDQDWPTPLSNSAAAETAAASFPANSNSSLSATSGTDYPLRDSGFGNTASPVAASPVTRQPPLSASALASTAQQPAGTIPDSGVAQIATYEPSNVTVASSSGSIATAASHYQHQPTTQPTAGPWRPGSTTSVAR